MAKLSKAESKRLYSWWWDSHIPKNSKWLQENLSDMDVKVKSMLKLIEEDADSFAKRADMYYKKRPELIKLVEEFYRAYRSLAESYDNANGTLRQAQISMVEAFPDEIPSELRHTLALTLKNDEQPSSNYADDDIGDSRRPSTPVLSDNDGSAASSSNNISDKKKEIDHSSSGRTSDFRRLMEVYSSGGARKGSSSSDLGEDEEKKKCVKQLVSRKTERVSSNVGGDFEEKTGKSTGSTTWGGDILKLTTENRNLKKQVQSESSSRSKVEGELQLLQAAHAKLETQREDALLQLRKSLTRITSLEAEIEIFKTQNSQITVEISRLESAEESRKQMETGKLRELEEELGALKIAIKDEHMRCVHAEAALESLSKLNSMSVETMRISTMEIEKGVQKLKEVEEKNKTMEDQLEEALSKIQKLNEENSLSHEAMTIMEDRICNMNEEKKKLEDEVEIELTAKNSLNVQLVCLTEQICDLQRIHKHIVDQIEDVGLSEESLQESVKGLQNDNIAYKEVVKKVEDENALLVKKLEDRRDQITEKKAVLETSLLNSNTDLENLRLKIKEVEESREILLHQNSALESEKNRLVSLVDTVTIDMEKLNERNGILENSLSDSIVEVEGLQERLKSLEDTCQSLEDDKLKLENQNKSLISQVGTMGDNLENLGYKFAELQVMHYDLLKEKESKDEQLSNLQHLLQFQKQQYESMLNSSNLQLSRLEDEICRLHEEGDYTQPKRQQVRLFAAEIEAIVLQRYMMELKANESKLSEEWKKMEQYIQGQQGEDLLLSNHIKQLKQMMGVIWKALNNDNNNNTGNSNYDNCCEIKDGAEGLYLDHILDKIKNMQDSIREFKDEKQSFCLEKSVYVTLLQQLGYHIADLRLEKNDLYQDCQKKSDEIVVLQGERNKLHEVLSKQENEGLTSRFSNLRDDIQLLEKEYNGIFQSAAVLNTSMARNMVNEELNTQIHQLDRLIENRIVQNKTTRLLESEGIRSELDKIKTTIDKLERRLATFMENKLMDKEKEMDEESVLESNKSMGNIEEKKDEETGMKGNEIRVCEEDFTVLWGDLHIANVHAVLFEERVVELMKLCESLEKKYSVEMEKLNGVEGQNSKMRDELNEYMSILPSLGESISSLESLILPLIKSSDQKKPQANEDPKNEAQEGILGLHKLLLKVDALREVLVEFRVESKKHPSSTNLLDGGFHVVDQLPSPSKMKDDEKVHNPKEWNKEVIRTLSVDTDKLTKLEEGVHDLKNKMENSKATNELLESFEFDVVKKQLGNAKETILHLVETNRKLIEKAQEDSLTSTGTNTVEEGSDDTINQKTKKKHVYNMRRGSAKIEKLELELNKLQDVLGKLEKDYDSRHGEIGEKKYRVLLKDYFYGRSERKRRKKIGGHFCGCIGMPSSKDD